VVNPPVEHGGSSDLLTEGVVTLEGQRLQAWARSDGSRIIRSCLGAQYEKTLAVNSVMKDLPEVSAKEL